MHYVGFSRFAFSSSVFLFTVLYCSCRAVVDGSALWIHYMALGASRHRCFLSHFSPSQVSRRLPRRCKGLILLRLYFDIMSMTRLL